MFSLFRNFNNKISIINRFNTLPNVPKIQNESDNIPVHTAKKYRPVLFSCY